MFGGPDSDEDEDKESLYLMRSHSPPTSPPTLTISEAAEAPPSIGSSWGTNVRGSSDSYRNTRPYLRKQQTMIDESALRLAVVDTAPCCDYDEPTGRAKSHYPGSTPSTTKISANTNVPTRLGPTSLCTVSTSATCTPRGGELRPHQRSTTPVTSRSAGAGDTTPKGDFKRRPSIVQVLQDHAEVLNKDSVKMRRGMTRFLDEGLIDIVDSPKPSPLHQQHMSAEGGGGGTTGGGGGGAGTDWNDKSGGFVLPPSPFGTRTVSKLCYVLPDGTEVRKSYGADGMIYTKYVQRSQTPVFSNRVRDKLRLFFSET
eukprot:Filipodium_phascolosomae@DN4758_c0_g1_i1.p1